MNPINDDDIDALIRQSFDGPVPDGGFSDRMMQQLPPRRRRGGSTGPLLAGVIAGTVLCALSLSGSPLWHAGWQGWLTGEWSGSTLIVLSAMAAMSLLALAWTLAEAEDHSC